MTTYTKQQFSTDKSKDVLLQVLAKEENKSCADCHAKGPRWASWNIGVILCIRCSGIHRSLGVHISRVKSVNLDTWTSEQLISICSHGNNWAKEKYEAQLPTTFKRPQTDQGMEHFIRDKYERLKFCTKEDIPLRPLDEFNFTSKKTSKTKLPRTNDSVATRNDENAIPRRRAVQMSAASPQPVYPTTKPVTNGTVNAKAGVDLLGLHSPSVPVAVAPKATQPPVPRQIPDQRPSSDLTFDIFASMQSNYVQNPSSATNNNPSQAATTLADAPQTMSKDNIMSLYGMTSSTAMMPNPYAVAGSYNVPPQQPMMVYQQPLPQTMPANGNYSVTGYPQQVPMQQGMPTYAVQQPTMQAMQQLQWQQQQMQMQMQNMNFGLNNGVASQGSMRSFNSMPQMSPQQQVYGGMQNVTPAPGMLTASQQSGLASSQPSMMNSWGATARQDSGQSLRSNLWQ